MVELRSFKEIWEKYEYFIFDSDGTLLDSEWPIKDSLQVLAALSALHKKYYIYSNNTKRLHSTIVARYTKNNFNLNPACLHTAASMTALYLQQRSEIKSVYLIGTPAFKAILEAAGIPIVGWGADAGSLMTDTVFEQLPTPTIDAVVIGGDYAVNYYKLAYASLCIHSGAQFIVADNDPSFQYHGLALPAGAFSSVPIEVATGQKPIVIGKPAALGLELLMKKENIPSQDQSKMLIIGDSYEADIMLGINAGIDTLLVLSGVSDEKTLASVSPKPTYWMTALTL